MSGARPNPVARPVPAWRRQVVLGVLGLGCLVVLGRAFQLQVLERDFLRQEGDKRHIRSVTIPAHRGAIVDRRGEPLALSAPVESLWAVPSALLESRAHLVAVAKLLEKNPRSFERFLSQRKERKFVYISDPLPPAEAQRVLSLKAPGVFSEPAYARYYPAGEVAGQVVGFCGRDGDGLEGVEKAQEALLGGRNGQRRVIRDRQGRVVDDSLGAVAAQPGKEVQLTLDLRIQYLAYRELKAAVAANNAKGGIIVVVDSSNGEILAIASQPGFNPNNAQERTSRGARNRAIVDSFEPGSTVKPLLVAQALELGLYQPTSLIDTNPGTLKVGALTVRDVHPQGIADLTKVLSKSSNVAAAKIGLTLGAEAVWNGYQRFGLGDPVYSGFPGEATPVLRHFTEWGQIATATASYGYGLSVNALHLVRAFSALANDGLMPQLRLVRHGEPPPPQRAVSPQTARNVRRMMEGVVSPQGTGLRAAIPGYRVAAKTGTVRKVSENGGYHGDKHYSVIIGMMPARNPRLVGLVMIDEPSAGAYYGGLVAGPVFSRVMQGAARLLQIAPDDSPGAPPLWSTAEAPPAASAMLNLAQGRTP